MRGSPLIAASALACCFTLLSCDKGDDADRADLEAAGAAMLGGGKDDNTKELEAKEAAERSRAFEERKAKEAAQEARLEAIAARAVKAAEKPSKDLDAACTALIEIYAEWIKTVYFDDDGEQLSFFDSRKKNLGVVKGNCAKLQSIPAADCMTGVIAVVSAEDFTEEDAKLLQGRPDYLFDKCAEQFAPER